MAEQQKYNLPYTGQTVEELLSRPIPTELSQLNQDSTHRVVTDTEKSTWNAKYSKPSGGIPSSDLSNAVKSSLNKADTALQDIPIASSETLGGIKVGTGLSIEADGTLNSDGLSSVSWDDVTDKPEFATVATSGSYNDLTNKPSIPAAQVNSDWNSTSGVSEILNKPDLSNYATQSDLESKQDTLVSGTNIKTINNESILGSGNITIQGGSDNAVLYTEQSLTSEQQAQARTNIGAGTSSLVIDSSHKLSADLIQDGENNKAYTATEKSKLSEIESGAEVNVQSNWNESDSNSDAFIQNKPAIENFYFVQGSSSQAGSSTSGSIRSTKWEGTITGITTPTNGLKIAYRIGGNKGVSTGGAVLSIDGGTTYYPVVYNVNTVISTRYDIDSTLLLTFNSTQTATAYMESGVSSEITGCWQAMDYDSSSTYQIKGQYGTMTTSGATYRYRLLFTSADGSQWVPANTSTSTNATSSRTVNQTPIDPFGRIVYYNYTTAKSANTTMTASYLYTQYLVTLGYSFNRTGAALTLTTYAPIYIKCAPQSNGSAIIDADTPYVQSLPTTADGKIYIFLGLVYDATRVELYAEHPIYYYSDGAIRLWTNTAAGSSVSPATDTPEMDGTAAVGTSVKYAREDHVHPSDTSKADAATTLAGYGITDAKIESGTITLGSNTITPLTSETDPVFSASAAAGISSTDITNWNGKTSNVGTVTGVKMNSGSAINPDSGGVVDLGTVITSHQDISGKADKVSSATNGNFAGLDSNGNLTDSGKKAGDFQTALSTQTAYTSKGSATKVPQITTNTLGQVTGITEVTITQPDVSNFISKSDTAGLVKNDGSIDTNTYLTSAPVTSVNGQTGAVSLNIPSAPGTLDTTATTAQSTSSSEALSGTIKLHKVAKTGTYSDLIGTPTIPTVNNSTITVQANGSTVDTFTTNASSGKTINLGNYPTSTTAGLKIEVVSALPASPDSNTIYIVQGS